MRQAFKTIVGGRLGGTDSPGSYPRGTEILLKKASVDGEFAEVLVRSPSEAARLIGLRLEETERTILENTPADTLLTMIENTVVKRTQLSAFKTMSASIMMATLLATSSIACIGHGQEEGGDAPYPMVSEAEAVEITLSRMMVLQQALEQYKDDHEGNYVKTENWNNWAREDSLLEYVDHKDLFDIWYIPFRYEGIEVDGMVTGYRLESYGPDRRDSEDDLHCPIDPMEHCW